MKFYQKWKAYGNGNIDNCFIARVPGNLQSDYAKAHGFGDLNFGYNVKQFDEIESYSWTYETELEYDLKHGERLFFVSKGIDYEYKIFLNGKLIYSYEGMFKSVEIDVTDYLQDTNKLQIEIAPPPKRAGALKNDRMEADRSAKPPVSYGWDWHPRLIVSGIWDDTYLESRNKDYISYCEAFCYLSDDYSSADITFFVEGNPEISLFNPNGELIYRGIDKEITVHNPMLWWCNGQGEPNLYTYTVKNDSCEKNGTLGFRKIELVVNEGAWDKPDIFPKSRSVPAITIRLNGRNIFAKGSNWVNPEIFIGAITADKYEEQIKLAKSANMNIFRCWGGAFVNKDSFYELCDKYGIMVWQEFPLACNNYRGAHYLGVLETEAEAIIKRLRCHPCHVIWCGGNELFNAWSKMTEQSLALRLLNKLCYEYDRDKPFIMTSPLMGMAHGGYLFYDNKTGRDVLEIFTQATNTAYTEFGIPSIAEYDILQEIIPKEEIECPRPGTAWELHHGFNAWEDDTWLNIGFLENYFGKSNSVSEKISQSIWLQCEGLKAIFEEARRQKPYCSMAINWCYNEPWITAANNSLISYPTRPKKAFYEVAKALRPVLASARINKFRYTSGETFTAELWLLNDSPHEISDTVRAYIEIDGQEKFIMEWQTGKIEKNQNKRGHRLQYDLPEIQNNYFILRLKSDSGYGSEYKLHITGKGRKEETRKLN